METSVSEEQPDIWGCLESVWIFRFCIEGHLGRKMVDMLEDLSEQTFLAIYSLHFWKAASRKKSLFKIRLFVFWS